MKKSIFRRLMVTYLSIIFVVLIILSMLLAGLFWQHYYEQKECLLINEGKHMNDMVVAFLQGRLDRDHLNDELNTVDRLLQARIWVVDKNGLIYAQSHPEWQKWVGNRLSQEDMNQLLRGEVLSVRDKYDSQFDVAMLTVIVPMVIRGQIEGATLLHAPIYGIEAGLKKVYWMIGIGALLAIGLAFVIVYFLSRRIAAPLHQMNDIALEMADGRFEKRVTVSGDDEIAQLGKSFNHMAQALGQLENMRRDFVANVSHELRSPLTSIRGFIQAILDGTIKEGEREKYLSIVLEETGRLNRLINELLDVARLESGNILLSKETIDIQEEIRKILAAYINCFEVRGITWEIVFTEERLWVAGDRDRIHQVITNLTDNALRFTPEGGKIEFKVATRGDKVVIEISDTGSGIAPETLPYIWERFYKVDKARSADAGGTGLGLHIVKRLIEAHGERIEVESKVGEGTTFSFTLPRAYK